MLGLNNNVIYLLLLCFVWTTMWYIYCCYALFGQQCGIFTVAILCLDNNVVRFTVAMLGLDNNVI